MTWTGFVVVGHLDISLCLNNTMINVDNKCVNSTTTQTTRVYVTCLSCKYIHTWSIINILSQVYTHIVQMALLSLFVRPVYDYCQRFMLFFLPFGDLLQRNRCDIDWLLSWWILRLFIDTTVCAAMLECYSVGQCKLHIKRFNALYKKVTITNSVLWIA